MFLTQPDPGKMRNPGNGSLGLTHREGTQTLHGQASAARAHSTSGTLPTAFGLDAGKPIPQYPTIPRCGCFGMRALAPQQQRSCSILTQLQAVLLGHGAAAGLVSGSSVPLT